MKTATLPQHELSNEFETLLVDSIDDERAIKLANYLQTNMSLKHLHVSFANSCNALPVLEGILRHSKIKSITLSNINMDNDTAKTIQMIFAYNTVLRDFNISTGNAIEAGYMQDILLGLRDNQVIESAAFHTKECVFDYYTSLTLQELLLANKTLKQLHLGISRIPPGQSFKAIGQGIACNSTLTSLCGLHCAPEDAPLFVEALSYNETLQDVYPSLPAMDACLEVNRRSCQHADVPISMENVMPPMIMMGNLII